MIPNLISLFLQNIINCYCKLGRTNKFQQRMAHEKYRHIVGLLRQDIFTKCFWDNINCQTLFWNYLFIGSKMELIHNQIKYDDAT